MDLLSKIMTPIGAVKSDTPDAVSIAPVVPAAPAAPVAPAAPAAPAAPVNPLDAVAVGEDQLLSTPTAAALPPPLTADPGGELPPETVKRKRGAPKGNKNWQGGEQSQSNVPNIADLRAAAENVAVDYKLMSEATFDLSTGVMASTLGPEWNPKTEEERQMVCKPLARYFEWKKMKDLPPNLALALVCAAYSAPRLREPGTASKLRMLWAWCKDWVLRLRGK